MKKLLFAALVCLAIPAQAQLVSTPSVVLAGMGTPASNSIPCMSGNASISTGAFYLQRDATGNGIWKCVLSSDGSTYGWIAPSNNLGPLAGSTSIGGSLLALGGTTTGTATVTGATVGSNCIATTSDGTYVANINISCNVATAGVATVTLQAFGAGTPAAKTYNVRVIQ
jgi:hypothetical protein